MDNSENCDEWMITVMAGEEGIHCQQMMVPSLICLRDHCSTKLLITFHLSDAFGQQWEMELSYPLLLQALLSVKQEKEIQMKMVVSRGESVLQNTSSDGVPALQQQLQSLKDMWASLLSTGIRCKR